MKIVAAKVISYILEFLIDGSGKVKQKEISEFPLTVDNTVLVGKSKMKLNWDPEVLNDILSSF